MIASAVPVLAKIVDPAKIPTVAGEVGMVRNGCLASVSVDYYTLGKMTGEMGADILDGKSTPAKMPIRRQLDGELVINMKTAKRSGSRFQKTFSRRRRSLNDGSAGTRFRREAACRVCIEIDPTTKPTAAYWD